MKEGKVIKRLEAMYTIAGTMIGAGILALPSSMAISGFPPGLFAMLVIGFLSILTALYVVEAFLRTEGDLHMPALAQRYFGKPGLMVMFIGILIYVYGALAGYLSAGGNLIYELSGGTIPFWAGTIIYFVVSTTIVFFGLHMAGWTELILFSIMIVFVFIIAGMAWPHANPELLVAADWSSLPAIFGIVLFAYVCHVVIPTVAGGMKHDKKGLIIATIAGMGLPMLIYVLWSVIFMAVIPQGEAGVVVPATETVTLAQAKHYGQPSTIPLGHLIGGTVIVIGSIFAILSTFTSYLGFGLSMTDCWIDLLKNFRRNLPRVAAILLSVLIPFILALTNPGSFLAGIDIAGMYGGSLFGGILPPLLLLAARKKGERSTSFRVPGGSWLPIIVLLFFLFGVGYRTYQIFMG